MRCALVIAAVITLTGCPGLKRHSTRNAPGVVDVMTSPPRLNAASMDPEQQELPADPGENQLGVAPGFWIQPGFGRMYNHLHDAGALELGIQLHVSFGRGTTSGGMKALGYPVKGWGATLGWGIVQFGFDDTYSTEPTRDTPTVMGPISLEATHHWFYGLGVRGGLAIYPTPGEVGDGSEGGIDAGGQLSVFAGPFAMKLRYIDGSGIEFFGGYQLWLPTSITWSR